MDNKTNIVPIKSKLDSRRVSNADRLLAYARNTKSGSATGIPAFDEAYRLKGFVGIVGEPEACKSVLVLQTALHNALNGTAVYFVDMELGEEVFLERMLCSLSSRCWNSWKAQTDEKFIHGFNKITSRVNMFVNNDDHKLEVILAEVEQLCKREEKVILVLDSLQAVTGNGETMRAAIDGWLEALDALKMKYRDKLTIMVTIEKRRGTYGEASKDAAKESGRIEYKVEMLFDLRVSPETGKILIECTKNRFGPKAGVIALEKLYEPGMGDTGFIFKLGGAGYV